MAQITRSFCPDCPTNRDATTWLLSEDSRALVGPFCRMHADARASRSVMERGEHLRLVSDPDNLPESRYPVRWWSESQRSTVTLESMHDAHLLNAYTKLGRMLNYKPEDDVWSVLDGREYDPTARFMAEEIRRRGLTIPAGGAR